MIYDLGKKFCRFTQQINLWVGWLVMVLLAVLVSIVSVSVFCRYALDASITWASEAARYLCIWIGFLAASVALRERMHIGLTFFTDRMGKKTAKTLEIISQIAILVFLCFVVYLGFELANRQMRQTSAALMMPMGWVYMAIPVSSLLMGLQSFSLLVTDIMNFGKHTKGDRAC